MISSPIEPFVRDNHPRLLAKYARLKAAQVILIPAGIVDAALGAVEEFIGAASPASPQPAPISARPLSRLAVYYMQPRPTDEMAKIFAVYAQPTGAVSIEIYHDGFLVPLGSFTPGAMDLEAVWPRTGAAELLLTVVFVLTLCHDGGFVQSQPAGDRSFRRQLARASGSSSIAPILYCWQHQKTERNASSSGHSHGVALHWRRGHWRKGESHWRGAVDLTDHLIGRTGWHVWIDGMWVGDPAHGIRRKLYTPPVLDAFQGRRGRK